MAILDVTPMLRGSQMTTHWANEMGRPLHRAPLFQVLPLLDACLDRLSHGARGRIDVAWALVQHQQRPARAARSKGVTQHCFNQRRCRKVSTPAQSQPDLLPEYASPFLRQELQVSSKREHLSIHERNALCYDSIGEGLGEVEK
eukprot:681199-Rhodomonas_salina.1